MYVKPYISNLSEAKAKIIIVISVKVSHGTVYFPSSEIFVSLFFYM